MVKLDIIQNRNPATAFERFAEHIHLKNLCLFFVHRAVK